MSRACRIAAVVLVLACQARGNARPREFDGARAFGYLEQQMSVGPRVPGTPAHERTGDWILAELRARADSVTVQAFTHVTRDGKRLSLRNFLARFRPDVAERVLLLLKDAKIPAAAPDVYLVRHQRLRYREVVRLHQLVHQLFLGLVLGVLLALAALACETVYKVLPLEPPLFRRRVDWFRQNRAFDVRKARAELGYQPKVALREGLMATAAWYRAQRYL